MNSYNNFVKGISIVPKASTENNAKGDIELLTSDNKLRFYNGTVNDPLVSESVTATLTNKTLAAGSNTITGLTNSNLSGSAGISNANLANSSITINGSSVSLGGSVVITAANPQALTIGTGLTGTSYDGSSPVTITIDSTVVTLTGSQTLTNKTLTAPIIATISNTGTLTLPTSTDTLVGRATSDTLTNKTIAAGSNTISGITNSNLSGSAAITNANLATMAAHTFKGNNTGSSATPLDLTISQMQSELSVPTSSSPLALNAGGTGTSAASANAAFNALSPMTTGGDIIYGGASGAGTRLANGSSGQVLTSAGGTSAPTWTYNTGAWTSYTPTFAGMGTATNINFFWRRSGPDSIDIRGYFTAGTTTAALGTLTLPNSFNLTTSLLDGGAGLRSILGTYARLATTTGINATSRFSGYLTAYSGTAGTQVIVFQADSATNTFATTNANSLFSSGDIVTIYCAGIPVT